MHGRIGVYSQPAAGSTFWFEIPAVAAPVQAEQAPSYASSEREPDLRPLSILVAEDNPVNQKVIHGLLARRWGHSVTVVENGENAIKALESAGGGFDLVLMDMQMPVMDGVTAASRIRHLDGRSKTCRSLH